MNEFQPLSSQEETYRRVYLQVEVQAEAEARKTLGLEEGAYCMGMCHMVWGNMKRIFKEEYGIEWKTPAELNPDCFFD